MPAASEPSALSPDEARRLLAGLEPCRAAVLAVSGGCDSMALMWLAARWARETGWPGKLLVGVVDHGLRPEAADEAKFVQREARKLGLKPHVLKWTGPHPKTGIPAAAREARYELLFDLAGKCGAIVLTAHTQDDQAETLLMRLARGSGVDGLAGMEIYSMRNGIELLRPLLGVSRERLRATLREAGLSWIDDPTNENTAHERVRVRKALGVLEGLGLTREAIALSARRLGRARAALKVATGGLMQVAVRIEANSYAEIELERWLHGPAELQVRSIMELARLFGGGQEISLSGAERVRDWMTGERSRATTFAGCRFARRDKVIIAGREPARVGPVPVAMCGAGSRYLVWDNRYEIAVATRLLPAEVLPAAGVKELERPRGIPDFVWRGLPVVKTAGGELFAPVECAGAGQGPVFRLIQAPMQVHHQAGT